MSPRIPLLTATCLVTAAACGGKPGPTRPASAPAGVPAPHYAALFQPGASWRYEVHQEWVTQEDPETGDGGEVRQESTEEVTCTVTEVVSFPGAVASRIDCGVSDHDPIGGLWAADASGLYRIAEMPAGAPPVLDADALVLPAAPVARVEELTDPDRVEPVGTVTISREADAWCHEIFSMRSEASQQVCFGDDGVITRAQSGTATGMERYATFTLRR
jgi:hypothetical protein